MRALVVLATCALVGCSTLEPTCSVDNIEVETANTFTGKTEGRRISVYAEHERCWDVLDHAIKLHEKGKL